MEAVNILLRVDAFQDRMLVHMFRKRQLNQDAVDRIVLVQLSYLT